MSSQSKGIFTAGAGTDDDGTPYVSLHMPGMSSDRLSDLWRAVVGAAAVQADRTFRLIMPVTTGADLHARLEIRSRPEQVVSVDLAQAAMINVARKLEQLGYRLSQ